MSHIAIFINQHQRMLKKTVSYYFLHITVAACLAFAVTRDVWASLALSLLEPTVQAFAFFFHERYWERQSTLQVK